MPKWMVEFLRKHENRGNKSVRVNSIRITKSINLLLFCTGLWVRYDVDIFKLTPMHSPFMEKAMNNYIAINITEHITSLQYTTTCNIKITVTET